MSVTAGCTLPQAGPSAREIRNAAVASATGDTNFALVNLNSETVSTMERWPKATFHATFGNPTPRQLQRIGIGDVLQIAIWESASGGLFSPTTFDRTTVGSRAALLPEQVVGAGGDIMVPYAGRLKVDNLLPRQVEAKIVTALAGKAVDPQVLVTVTKNISNTVSVLGEVTSGARVPLSPHGDRILDVIASAGGVRAPSQDVFITLTRGTRSARVPMYALLEDPEENIYAFPGDTITVTKDPQVFTAIGATGRNDVIPFDSPSITLDQAIGRAGGLNDQRADASGVFVVRYERPEDYDLLRLARPNMAGDRIPTIYSLNLQDPGSLFVAHRFQMRNKDILFVSNAAATDVQKIGTIISTFLLPAGATAGVIAVTRQ